MATTKRPEQMTEQERREFMERNLRTMMMISAENAEMQVELNKMLQKIKPLVFEYREGHLFIGSEKPPKWEVRRSITGQVYCKCPAWAYRERPGAKKGNGDGLCKHVLFAHAMDLEIPDTGTLKAEGKAEGQKPY